MKARPQQTGKTDQVKNRMGIIMLDFANLDIYRENNRIEAKKAQGGLPPCI